MGSMLLTVFIGGLIVFYKSINQCSKAVHYLITCLALSFVLIAQSSNAQSLGGLYGVISAESNMDAGGYGRSIVSGQLYMESATNRFFVSGYSSSMELAEMCKLQKHARYPYFGKEESCQRNFNRKSEGEFIFYSGTYQLLEDLTIRFKLDGEQDYNPVEGSTNVDGSIVILPVHPADGANLIVGLRASGDLEPGAFEGVYSWNARVAEFPDDYGSRHGRWKSYESGIERGELAISGSGYKSKGEGSKMQSIFSCTSAGDGCELSAKQISRPSVTFPSSGRLSFTPWGGVSIQGNGTLLSGLVSNDGQFILAAEENSRKGRQGMIMMTRKGSGLDNLTVQGEYNALALEEFFSSDGRVRNAVVEGALLLDGETWHFSGTDSSVIRDGCAGSGDCPVGMSVFSAVGSAEGEYSVADNGEMTMNGIAIDGNPRFFQGNVSGDGEIIVLRRVHDNISCDFFCAGTQSIRSVILAVRRHR